MSKKDPYPQHARLKAVAAQTQFVNDFLTYLGEQGIYLYKDFPDGAQRAVSVSERDDNLYKYIKVDRWKLEDEKRAMVDSLNKPAPAPCGHIHCPQCPDDGYCCKYKGGRCTKHKGPRRRAAGGPPKRCKCGFKPGRYHDGAKRAWEWRTWRRKDSSLQCPQCGATVYNHI